MTTTRARLRAWLKLNGVWMITKCARWNVGRKLNWARSYLDLDDNKTCPTAGLVEIEWGLDANKMRPAECRAETELGQIVSGSG